MKITSAYANKLLKSLTDRNPLGSQEPHPALMLPPSVRNRLSRSMTTPMFLRH